MSNEDAVSTPRRFYAGVFLVSGLLMALQILQSRIFSVTTWYHLAFLVISIAMFGLTLAALKVHRGDAAAQRADYAGMMARASGDLGFFIMVALVAQLFAPIIHDGFWGTAVTLPLLSLLTVLPYYKAGIVLTLALTRAPFPVARTYGIDLAGAAAGCIAALVLMRLFDAPSAILCLCLVAFAASALFAAGAPPQDRGRSRRMIALAAAAAGMIAMNETAPKPLLYPLWVKSEIITQEALAFDRWNAISRITLRNEYTGEAPYLWGPSPLLPPGVKNDYYYLEIDGDASSPLYRFDGKRESLAFLGYDVTTLAYAVPGLSSAAIIGVGGGRDVLTAHYFGIPKITAMDINDVQIALLTRIEPYRSYAGIADLPGVELVHSEARSWFARNAAQFDLIQMSLIDTWAATGAGAFALSENGLYTVEAWRVFMEDLSPQGIFTVSRWYSPAAASETERLLALAAAALRAQGAEDPAAHIFVATAGSIATLVMGKRPLDDERLSALTAQAADKGFDVLIAPGRMPDNPGFAAILAAADVAALERLAAAHPFDISPPTDDRPFFFNQTRLGAPAKAIALVMEGGEAAVAGHSRATVNLYFILVFALLMVVFAILRPLYGAAARADRRFVVAGTAWFFLIGLGFMLLEVALLQRMSVFLGHPVYSLGIVLFSLVLATGIGSLLSDRWPVDGGWRRDLWCMATAALAMLMAVGAGAVFEALAAAGLPLRALACVAMTLPLGLLLGFGFPTGMALVRAVDEAPSAWFWGVNGAAGVMGSALAVALNIALGLTATILLGALCYLLLLLPGRGLARARRQPS